jgi:type I restriction enzyme S subunit
MIGWKKYRLSDIGILARGKSKHRPRDAAHLYGGKHPFIQTGDIKNANHKIFNYTQTYTDAGLAQSKLWDAGTICITIAANIGETAILTFPACFPDSVIGFIPDKSICNAEYIEYMLQFFKQDVQKHSIGSVQENINLGTFQNIEFPLPSLPTQSRIASILSSLDDKIELNRRMNQTLEQMAQALFNHYFIDNIDADNLPEGWVKGSIGNICFVQNGYAFKSKDFANKGSIGVIKIRNINNNIVDIHSTQFINEVVLNSLDKKFKVISEDILIAMTGAEVGKIGIVPNNSKLLWLNQRVGNIKEKNGYGKYFTYILLTSDSYQNELQTTAMGSAQPNISASDIENIKVLIPEEQRIHEFEIEVKPMFQKICQNLEEISILATIRDTLLPKLISGEIDVDALIKE